MPAVIVPAVDAVPEGLQLVQAADEIGVLRRASPAGENAGLRRQIGLGLIHGGLRHIRDRPDRTALRSGVLRSGALRIGTLRSGILRSGALRSSILRSGILQNCALWSGVLLGGAFHGGMFHRVALRGCILRCQRARGQQREDQAQSRQQGTQSFLHGVFSSDQFISAYLRAKKQSGSEAALFQAYAKPGRKKTGPPGMTEWSQIFFRLYITYKIYHN